MNRKICITCLFSKAISISDAVCPILGKVTAVPVTCQPPIYTMMSDESSQSIYATLLHKLEIVLQLVDTAKSA